VPSIFVAGADAPHHDKQQRRLVPRSVVSDDATGAKKRHFWD
jgi:hypothetical protein